MDKQRIIAEIRRTAAENGGRPLGELRFKSETGIGRGDWYEVYWANWNEALTEAGFSPNAFGSAIPDDVAIEKLALLIRKLGRYPRDADYRLHRRLDRTFPSVQVYQRIGRQSEVAAKVVEWCRERDGFDDVIAIAKPVVATVGHVQEHDDSEPTAIDEKQEAGSVYLLKSGKFHKIGRTNHLGRREYDIALQLPEKAMLVHEIQTDDPVGIEAYWHNRFADKRENGEWFTLNVGDVRAFKRWKRIY